MCAGIRRASGKAARRCLATFVGALLASLAGGWHAFVDFEASPDWPGTALTSNLQLTWLKRSNASCISGTLLHDGEARSVLPQNPSCEYYRQEPAEMCTTAEARNQCCECGGGTTEPRTEDTCETALVSLRRSILICSAVSQTNEGGGKCSRECEAAWNSTIRDAGNAVGSRCVSLEQLMNQRYPGKMSGDGAFEDDELESLARMCSLDCPTSTRHCGFSAHGSFVGAGRMSEDAIQTEPPPGLCPNFMLSNGISKFAVLTWQLFEFYRQKEWGCSGGMSLLADKSGEDIHHYESWACVHEPSCTLLRRDDDMVCYRYSSIRGEFHYWGLNSRLRLAEVPFMINASFCDASMNVLLMDARDKSRGIDLGNVRYTLTRDTPGGEPPHVLKGEARNNGQNGCGPILLRRNSKYHLEIDAGRNYYLYSSYVYTKDTHLRLGAAVMPALGGLQGQEYSHNPEIAISLSWSQKDAVDLDLFVFLTGPDGVTRVSEDYAVYWARRTPKNASQNFKIALEVADSGVDQGIGPSQWSYGAESARIIGDLDMGTYAVMAHVHNPDCSEDISVAGTYFHRGGASVSVYSSMLGGKGFTWTVAQEQHRFADWWHVFNIEVKEDFDPTIFGAVPRKRYKKVTMHNVDKMVRPGVCVSHEGRISGDFPVLPHKFSQEAWLREHRARTTRQELLDVGCDWQTPVVPRDGSMGTELRETSKGLVTCESTQMMLARYEIGKCCMAASNEPEVDGTWLEVSVFSAADRPSKEQPTQQAPLGDALVTAIRDEYVSKVKVASNEDLYLDDDALMKNPDLAQDEHLGKKVSNRLLLYDVDDRILTFA